MQIIALSNQTTFDYDFYIKSHVELIITVDGVQQEVVSATNLYTDTGGQFTLLNPMNEGDVIDIDRELNLDRQTSFIQNGDLTAKDLNKEFDNIYQLFEQSEFRNQSNIKIEGGASFPLPGEDGFFTYDNGQYIWANIEDTGLMSAIRVEEEKGRLSADSAEVSATNSLASAAVSIEHAQQSATYSATSGDSSSLSGYYATHPEDSIIPGTDGEFSAKHYAAKASQSLSQAIGSGGVHYPSSSEYPNVVGVIKDTQWIIGDNHTYSTGILSGMVATPGDTLFYDTPSNVFSLLVNGSTSVQSVNGKTGSNITLTHTDVGAIANTTTVNGQLLSGNITITLESLGHVADGGSSYVHPAYASSDIVNVGATVVSAISTNDTGHITDLQTRELTPSDIGALDLNSDNTISNGATTSLSMVSDDSGLSTLNVYGGESATGQVYVGQDINGGGIAFNGSSDSSTSGAGTDYLNLFTRNEGVDSWVMRSKYNVGDIEIANRLYVQNDTGESKEAYSGHNLTSGTDIPSGGNDGDVYIQYT